MSTHALVHFHKTNRYSSIILSLYKHFDGYVEQGLGDALKSGCLSIAPKPRMESAALRIMYNAQVLMPHDFFEVASQYGTSAGYEYHVFENLDGTIALTVNANGTERPLLTPAPKVLVSFSYQKPGGEAAWRQVSLIEEDETYLKGNDVDTGDFRCFLKSRILGGEKGIFREKEGK